MFAKLYGEADDQVLVVIKDTEDGPGIEISTQPEGYGVCSIVFQYEDNEDGWNKAESTFGNMTADQARYFADHIGNVTHGQQPPWQLNS